MIITACPRVVRTNLVLYLISVGPVRFLFLRPGVKVVCEAGVTLGWWGGGVGVDGGYREGSSLGTLGDIAGAGGDVTITSYPGWGWGTWEQ